MANFRPFSYLCGHLNPIPVPSFLKQLTLLTLVVVAGMLALGHFQPGSILPVSWYLLGYFIAITLVNFALVNQGLKGDPLDFSNGTMLATGVRMFVSAGILFYFYWTVKDQDRRVHFTATFFVLYFLYSSFEIKTLLSKLRRNSGKP
jgi:hypothetical protein